MKNTKRFLAMVLSLGLILTMLSPVSLAEETKGTITLDNPADGATYTLYRVFDLTYNDDVKAYTYTVANQTFETELFQKYPQLKSDSKKDGKVIINAEPLRDRTINPYDFSIWLNSVESPDTKFVKNDTTQTGTVKWTELDLGYYMIKSTAGTVVSLTSTDYDATVHEKNIKPTLTKKVKGGSVGDTASDLTYANIGEELTFKIAFDVHNHANTEYILKDVVPKGIDVDKNQTISVQIDDGTGNNLTNLDAGKYSVDKKFTDGTTEGTKELKIKFPVKTIQEIAESIRPKVGETENHETVDSGTLSTKKTITITYKGKLNTNALMSNHTTFNDDNVNRNDAELVYDPNTTIESIKADADVRTTEFQIKKFAKKGETEEVALANAKFKIYTTNDGTEPIKFSKLGENEDYIYDTAGTVTEITTKVSNPANVTTDGLFSIKGLKTGTYYIEESAAPDGFNPLQKRIPLTIAEGTNNISYTLGADSEGTLENNIVKIENKSGAELPETGGIGRTIIYVLGAILFFGALILLVARKRTKEQRA